jgi:hypothetical protein
MLQLQTTNNNDFKIIASFQKNSHMIDYTTHLARQCRNILPMKFSSTRWATWWKICCHPLINANGAVHMSATKNCANVSTKTNRAFFAGMTVKQP